MPNEKMIPAAARKGTPPGANPPRSLDDRHTGSDYTVAFTGLAPLSLADRYPHYHKDVSHLDSIDVYRVLDLFGVTDQALGHAIKKLLVAGGRGAGKNIDQDVKEAIDTLTRRQGMQVENQYRNQK